MTYRKMRKRVRKPLAVALSVSMIMSSINMSALASEAEEKNGEPSVSVSVTVTETTDENTGDTTSTTVTETNWSDTQENEIEAEAGTEGGEDTGAEAGAEGNEDTGAEAGTEGSEDTGAEAGTEGGEDTGTESGVVEGSGTGNTAEEVGPGVTVTETVTVEGSETATETSVTNKDGVVTEESGTISGQETTTVETVTTETETAAGQLIEEITTPIETSGSEDGAQETIIGEWVSGEETFGEYQEGEWVDEEPAEGETVQKETEKESTTVVEDILEDENIHVELNLTPADNANDPADKAEVPIDDDEEKIYVGWDNVSTIPEAGTEDVLDENGNKIGTKETTVEAVKDTDGNVIRYEVTTVTTTITEGEPTEGETQETGKADPVTVTSAPELPEGTAAGTEDLLDTDGSKIGTVETVIEEIKDASGNVIGYTITEITTENIHAEEHAEAAGETSVTTEEPAETFVLPEKPEAGETTNEETGVKTVTTVEDIVENGEHVGYQTITVELDADGKELSRTTESVYGTAITVNTTVTTDPTGETVTTDTTKVTTSTTTIMGTTTTQEVALTTEKTTTREIIEVVEEDTWELVAAADGSSYFLYKGEMYAVIDQSTLQERVVDLNVDLNDYAPDGTNDIRANPNDGGGYTGQILTDTEAAGNGNVYFGYGLYSNFLINDENGKGHEVRQYAIKDANGDVSYVYCVELGTAVSTGAYYGENHLEDGNLYANEDVGKLTTVAQNGFWGTDEGVGSLEAVKDLLMRNGFTEESKSLTAGQALAATQAAIWEYGTAGTKQIDDDDLIYGEFTYVNGKAGFNENVSTQDKNNIETLRNLLLELAEDNPLIHTADQISADDLTGATIVLEKKAENADGTTKTADVNGQAHDVYNADLSFTLAVSTSAINGDLLVQVTDAAGTIVATRRLAGEDSEGYGKIYPNESGTYTIADIELKEGVMITLNLTGTQQLADGIYVYNHSDYQDFIGLSTLENDVNLSVDLIFEVEDPSVEIAKNGTEKTIITGGSKTDIRTGSRTDSREDYTTETDTTTKENGQSVKRVYADVTVTEVTEETRITSREWNSSWKDVKDIKKDTDDDDNGGGGGGPSGGGGDSDDGPGTGGGKGNGGGNDDHVADDAIIIDEPVALAGLPKTGDRTGRWTLWAVLSGLGLAIMSLTGRKREEEEPMI